MSHLIARGAGSLSLGSYYCITCKEHGANGTNYDFVQTVRRCKIPHSRLQKFCQASIVQVFHSTAHECSCFRWDGLAAAKFLGTLYRDTYR